METTGLTAEEQVAWVWPYAATQHAPPHAFTIQRIGGVNWARHMATPDGPEYRLPGNGPQRFAASCLLTLAEGNRYLLHLGWEGWAHVQHSFAPPPASAHSAAHALLLSLAKGAPQPSRYSSCWRACGLPAPRKNRDRNPAVSNDAGRVVRMPGAVAPRLQGG